MHAANCTPFGHRRSPARHSSVSTHSIASKMHIRGKPPEVRQRVRQDRAVPLLEDMKRSLEATLLTLFVKSDITKAIQYSLNRWPALVYYYSDGQAAIDNLIDERALRDVAIGRRNFLFAGTDSGGECAAAMYTLIGSARLNGIDPEARCIKFDDKRFYLEFTPSVPLATVPASMIEIQGLHAFFEAEYEETALAVVDTPTQRWKTSNPAGQCEWIGKVARRVLVDSASQYRPGEHCDEGERQNDRHDGRGRRNTKSPERITSMLDCIGGAADVGRAQVGHIGSKSSEIFFKLFTVTINPSSCQNESCS